MIEMIVDLWITTRGFAFASSKWQVAKKLTQKTKGIRKTTKTLNRFRPVKI